MTPERKKGVIFSSVMHLLLLVLVIFGLPNFLTPPPPIEPAAITVELLPITGITNVKPAEQPPAPTPKPEVKPEEPKPEPKKPEPEKPKPPSPPVKTSEAAPAKTEEKKPEEKKPEEKKPEPKKEAEIKKPEEKKPEEKKPEKKNKASEEDLAKLLNKLKKEASDSKEKSKDKNQKTDSQANSSPNKSTSNKYDDSLPMSLSEKDAIMSQIAKCWNVPAGVKDAYNLVVTVNAEFSQDGTLINAVLSHESMIHYGDSTFRAAADAAVRAVKQCSPLQNLPPEKYQTWKKMELRFDPKYMLY